MPSSGYLTACRREIKILALTREGVDVLRTGQRKLVVLQNQELQAVTATISLDAWRTHRSLRPSPLASMSDEATAALKLGLVGWDTGPFWKS